MLTSILVALGFICLGYCFGSIPTGYWIAKAIKGIDIRECGSGSTGATNVLRNVGKLPALVVFLVDFSKGTIAIALLQLLYQSKYQILPSNWQTWLIILTGLAAIIGHSKSILLNFSGGKSVATSIGIFLMINPLVAISTFSVFLVVLAISRIVSLSSIIGAIAVGIFMIILQQPPAYIVLGVITGLYVIWLHRGNIERLLAGTEPRLGQTI